MKAFQWKDDYCIGNEEIDAQHKKWFEIFNDAHDKMLGNIESDISAIGPEALKKALDYTKYHFSFEEQYMLENKFPDFERHKSLHKNFIQKLNQMILEKKQGEYVLNSEIIKTIENWLIYHILEEDQKLTK